MLIELTAQELDRAAIILLSGGREYLDKLSKIDGQPTLYPNWEMLDEDDRDQYRNDVKEFVAIINNAKLYVREKP